MHLDAQMYAYGKKVLLFSSVVSIMKRCLKECISGNRNLCNQLHKQPDIYCAPRLVFGVFFSPENLQRLLVGNSDISLQLLVKSVYSGLLGLICRDRFQEPMSIITTQMYVAFKYIYNHPRETSLGTLRIFKNTAQKN